MLQIQSDKLKSPHCPSARGGDSAAYSLILLNTRVQAVTRVDASSLIWRAGSLGLGAVVSDGNGTIGTVTDIGHCVVITTLAAGNVTSSESSSKWQEALDKKADLTDGLVPPNQIPIDWIKEAVNTQTGVLNAETRTAATAINGHRFVSCREDGLIVAAGAEYPFVLGMITNAVNAGAEAEVIVSGIITHPGWNFDTTKPILLGLTGQPVQTLDDMPIVRCGIALSPTSLFLRIEQPTF